MTAVSFIYHSASLSLSRVRSLAKAFDGGRVESRRQSSAEVVAEPHLTHPPLHTVSPPATAYDKRVPDLSGEVRAAEEG